MNTDAFRIPTDEEIDSAEQKLGLKFHQDYRNFLKSGGNVANALFDAAVILPGSSRLDLFEIAATAWNVMGVPKNLLPFIEDNGDYFCISPSGEVYYWSHNGPTNEKWSTFSKWYQQVCVERR